MRRAPGRPIPKPKGPSDTAGQAPTPHSKSVEERLGELRNDLVAQRRRRRLIRANVAVIALGVLVMAAEISALATGIIEHRATLAAIAFAISAALAFVAGILALNRLAKAPDAGDLLTAWCRA